MQAKKPLAGLAMLTLTLGLAGGAHAQLFKRDLLTGDQLLVFDDASGLEWLQPVATNGFSYQGAEVQSLISSHGLRYASFDEVRNMISNNFGTLKIFPESGDYPSKLVADRYFEWFVPTREAPEINGYSHSYGMAALDGLPYAGLVGVYRYSGLNYGGGAANSGSGIIQNEFAGSWLVRPVSPVPEPASALLMLSGLGVVGWWRRRQR